MTTITLRRARLDGLPNTRAGRRRRRWAPRREHRRSGWDDLSEQRDGLAEHAAVRFEAAERATLGSLR